MTAGSAAAGPTYTSTFIFEIGTLDDDFHRMNDEIAERARAIPGFLGEESWHNEDTGLHAEVYYWSDREALHQLVGMDTHRLAKGRHGEWLGEYRVVIAEVKSIYGNPVLGLEHRP
jgi:heme-degrading monooxygenase HmoA